jgi:hypothetical protein
LRRVVLGESHGTLHDVKIRYCKLLQTFPKAVVKIGSPVGGPHSSGEIRGAAAVNVLSRFFAFAFAARGGALGQEERR